MNKVTRSVETFTNIDFGSIRCVNDNGTVMFAGVDVARALGHKNPRNAVNTLVPKADKQPYRISVRLKTRVNPTDVMFITEAGLYRLIFSSNLPNAVKFQDWVFRTVLPSMRALGINQENFQDSDGDVRKELQRYKELDKLNNAKIEELKAKVMLVDILQAAEVKFTIPELANNMTARGFDIGGNKLYKYLRELGLLKKIKSERNRPTKFGVDKGLVFEHVDIESTAEKPIKVNKKTCVTTKGVDYVADSLMYLGEDSPLGKSYANISADKHNADGFIVLDFVDEEATKKAMKNRKH